jgi:hypothetical protein
VTALSDQEESPPFERSRYYGENAETLRPPPEKVAEINAELVRHEAERSAEVLQALQAALPGVATKAELAAIMVELQTIAGGIRLALGGIANLERDVRDIKAAIGGDGGMAQKIDGLREGVGGALAGVEQAKRLARATYDGVFHGPGAVSAEEQAACEAIR